LLGIGRGRAHAARALSENRCALVAGRPGPADGVDGPAEAGQNRRIRRLTLFLLIALPLALLVCAWSPGFSAPYQYDDYVTPVKDPASQSLTAWIESIPTTLRPLTKLSFAIESSLGATSAASRRWFNAALFGLATWLVYGLARFGGLGREPAAALATLWALHPVHAETILALAGRSVLLSLVLCLASAWALTRNRALAAVTFAVFAVLARETAWLWLVACVGFVTWRKRRSWFVPALLLATAGGAAMVLASSRMRTLLGFSFSDSSVWNRLGLQWAALPRGVLLWFFAPSAFNVDMDFAPLGWSRVAYLLAAIALYAFAAWLALGAKRGTAFGLAALLWLCLVVPLHSVVPKLDPLTARTFSASSAAVVVLLAAALAGSRASQFGAGPRLAFWSTAALLGLVLLGITRERAALYRDPIALWRDAAARSTRSTRPLINLGTLLAQDGQLEEARAVLTEAARRSTRSPEAKARLDAVYVLIETKKMLTQPGARDSNQAHEPAAP
jgi:protein O-mannosyl-transferase